MKKPARTSPPSGPFIRDLNVVDDLAVGQRAMPEPGVAYELNMIDRRRLDVGTVEHVFREGDVLLARMTSGKAFPVTGFGAPVLVVRG